MGNKYFPLYMDLSEKKVLVVGGGRIAGRRVNTLLGFVDRIIVVSPDLGTELEEIIFEKCPQGVMWMQDYYQKGYLEDADIVLACTNVKVINDIVESDCRKLIQETGKQILFSRCDDKDRCDFFFPSIVEQDGIIVGINSGGESPDKTKEVRKKIEEALKSESIY